MKKSIGVLFIVFQFSIANSVLSAGQAATHAKDAGYKSCLSTVSDLETFFADNKNYGTWTFSAVENPDDQIFNATLELSYGDQAQLIDFTVAPTKDGMCSYSYTRSWYSPMSCMATSKQDYMKNAEYKTEINKLIAAFNEGNVKWLLMPTGSGCLVQKKEIGFRHKKQGS